MHQAPFHLRPVLLIVAIASVAGCGDDNDSYALAADAGERDKPDAGKTSTIKPAIREPDASTAQDAATREEPKQPEGNQAQPITLRFHAQVGDKPFACGQSYAAQGSTNQTVTPRDLRMFIQDVALLDDKGNEVPVKLDKRDPWQTEEVALLDFEDATGECFGTADMNTEISGTVPKGNYSALRFSNGVPDKLNHSDPKTFPPPLKTPGMSWNWLLGLRFMRFEMATENVDSDAGADAASVALHIGSTACSGSQNEGTITCAKPNRSRVELKGFELGKSEVVLDVSKLLRDTDLSKLVECHSASAPCEPMFKAVGLSYETGKPSSDQTAYSLQ